MASPGASSVTLSNHDYDDDSIQLTDVYLIPGSRNGPSPSMRAAGNPDSSILKHVLSSQHQLYQHANSEEFGSNTTRFSGAMVGISSPLLVAIRTRSLQNVTILLEAGADPNGLPLKLFEQYSAFFLRFRPRIPKYLYDAEYEDVASRKIMLSCMDLPQLSGLTIEEVEDRFNDGMAPFWCEQGFTETNHFPYGDQMSAVIAAARAGSCRMIDQVIEAGADTSFWTSQSLRIPDPPTPSSLCISTPIHAAIKNGRRNMVMYLIEERRFNPNVMPLATPTRCFTPLMATIIDHQDPENTSYDCDAFEIFENTKGINFEIRTPVYNVHILHFAVARLDLKLLKRVLKFTPLWSAGSTALGHNLLHIACLPLDSTHIQRHVRSIFDSIHETRDLSGKVDIEAWRFSEPFRNDFYYTNEFEAQIEVVKYLYRNGIDLNAQDIHGNNPLHYLAGYKRPNSELIEWLLCQPYGDKAWTTENCYGSTPFSMYRNNKQIREIDGDHGPRPWFERGMMNVRQNQKQRTWRRLLMQHDRGFRVEIDSEAL